MSGLKKHIKAVRRTALLLLVAGFLCCFAAQKEGYHMDELLSLELSNAFFNPWIVPTQPEGRLAKFIREEIRGESFGETMRNIFSTGADLAKRRGGSKLLQYKADVYSEPVWISGEEFTDYITTGEGDRFNYLSVYFNVKDDNHPPLHFMLLHTISSLFPGTVSPFLGCAINILAILGCVVCFFGIGGLLEAHGLIPAGYGDICAGCAGILYGLSTGGTQTALLIRMYALMTFFCVLLFYLHIRKWLRGEFGSRNLTLVLATVLGFLTQYFFLFYCLSLAAVTAGLLITRRRIPELKRYILSMMLAAVIGVILFPFAISDVFSSGRGVEALQNLGSGFAGYGYRLSAFGQILMESCFGSPAIGVMLLTGLVSIVCVCLSVRREKVISREDKALLLMLVLPITSYFLLAARMSPYLVDRYLMPLFPFAALLLTLLFATAYCVCRKRMTAILKPAIDCRSAENPVNRSDVLSLGSSTMQKRRFCAWIGTLVFLTTSVNIASCNASYLYSGYDIQLQIARQYRELPCVCLYDGVGYYENLPEFTEYDKTLLLKLSELERRQERASLEQPEELIVLKKVEVDEKKTLELLEEYGWQVEKLLSEADSVHGDTIYLCRRTSNPASLNRLSASSMRSSALCQTF